MGRNLDGRMDLVGGGSLPLGCPLSSWMASEFGFSRCGSVDHRLQIFVFLLQFLHFPHQLVIDSDLLIESSPQLGVFGFEISWGIVMRFSQIELAWVSLVLV